jgi:hypothetical protein
MILKNRIAAIQKHIIRPYGFKAENFSGRNAETGFDFGVYIKMDIVPISGQNLHGAASCSFSPFNLKLIILNLKGRRRVCFFAAIPVQPPGKEHHRAGNAEAADGPDEEVPVFGLEGEVEDVRYFERFYSERPDSDREGHSGLGLAIVKAIAEGYGGSCSRSCLAVPPELYKSG